MVAWALQSTAPTLPLATFIVNVVGCFAIGIVSKWQETRGVSEFWAVFLAVGLLGGFTTFSAFGNETALLVRHGRSGLAVANVVAHLTLALGAVWAGRAVV